MEFLGAGATLPASDIERGKAWYKDMLGLEPSDENPGGVTYTVGNTRFSLYPSQFAGTAQNTAMDLHVGDLEAAVDELTARGVTFEQYDFPGLKTNEKGIADLGPDMGGAWFKDSEGNILALGTT